MPDGLVIWLYGLSGAGKTTLSRIVAERLQAAGRTCTTLDGDELRRSLCADLGFGDEDRRENIRRAANAARVAADEGKVVLCAFICPRRELRELARGIVGADRFMEVFVKADFATCAARDVKGLYAKAAAGQIRNFTGRDSAFEEPPPDSDTLTIDTTAANSEDCATRIIDAMAGRS